MVREVLLLACLREPLRIVEILSHRLLGLIHVDEPTFLGAFALIAKDERHHLQPLIWVIVAPYRHNIERGMLATESLRPVERSSRIPFKRGQIEVLLRLGDRPLHSIGAAIRSVISWVSVQQKAFEIFCAAGFLLGMGRVLECGSKPLAIFGGRLLQFSVPFELPHNETHQLLEILSGLLHFFFDWRLPVGRGWRVMSGRTCLSGFRLSL